MTSSPVIYCPISAGISEISGSDDALPLKHFSVFFLPDSREKRKKESKESVGVYLSEDDMFFSFFIQVTSSKGVMNKSKLHFH